jgi:hypothetical protein
MPLGIHYLNDVRRHFGAGAGATRCSIPRGRPGAKELGAPRTCQRRTWVRTSDRSERASASWRGNCRRTRRCNPSSRSSWSPSRTRRSRPWRWRGASNCQDMREPARARTRRPPRTSSMPQPARHPWISGRAPAPRCIRSRTRASSASRKEPAQAASCRPPPTASTPRTVVRATRLQSPPREKARAWRRPPRDPCERSLRRGE